MNIQWKDWCWSWSSNTLVTWCEEMTHWKRPWCWSWRSNTLATWREDLTLKKYSDAGKDWRQEEKGTTENEMVGWHHWVDGHEFWVGSGSWWWTGKPGVLQSMGSQRIRHDWATELNQTDRLQSMGSWRVGDDWSDLAAAAASQETLIQWVESYTCILFYSIFFHWGCKFPKAKYCGIFFVTVPLLHIEIVKILVT